ncbi:MAG: redoxin domain-containing protein [Phycisphaerales bacterium]|nr:MAG: redoxin domain-containing protein [Phycisphaerales bacterium]
MKTKVGVCLTAVALLVFVALVGRGRGQQAAASLDKLGKPAAPLKGLQWIKGGPVEIEKGSAYVVEFWATWCPPCRRSIPHLTELQRRFKDKGVTIIGISNEAADIVKPFVAGEKAGKMDYTVAIDPQGHVSNGYMGAFGIGGIPHAFIVGKDGNLAWHGHPLDGMDEVLEEVLAGQFDYVGYAKKKAAEEAEQARLVKLYGQYFAAARAGGDKAAEIGAQLVDSSDHAEMLNALAWNILTEIAKANRDLELAHRAAAKAVKLTEEKNPALLDTYALALYELGKKYVGQAVAYQKKAVALAEGDEQARQGMQKALDRYEAASVE